MQSSASNVSQDVGGVPVVSNDLSNSYSRYINIPYNTITTNVSYTSNTTSLDPNTVWYYPQVNYPDEPKITRWNNQVFYEPSAKLKTLFTALQLL